MSLTDLTTAELESLAGRVRRGDAECPLESTSPSVGALVARAPELAGHGRDATLAILGAVLAERARPRPSLELVWTGPDARAGMARDTAVVVREMFAAARRCVLIAGYAFDHGAEILRPLHEVMRDRGVEAELFLDVPRARAGVEEEDAVMRHVDAFARKNWPFGAPEPRCWYDPRTVAGDEYASIHAKCVVVDERSTLIGSANFTERGQSRNVEVGVCIDDEDFARRLVHQWRQLAQSGRFVRCR